MNPGSVLFYRNFTFDDGIQSDKLLITLSPIVRDRILAVKTTSKQKRRPLKDGCHPSGYESVFTFNANLAGFKTTTWIILTPYILNISDLLQKRASGDVSVKFELRMTDLRAVINCLKKSDDVSADHLSYLQ